MRIVHLDLVDDRTQLADEIVSDVVSDKHGGSPSCGFVGDRESRTRAAHALVSTRPGLHAPWSAHALVSTRPGFSPWSPSGLPERGALSPVALARSRAVTARACRARAYHGETTARAGAVAM